MGRIIFLAARLIALGIKVSRLRRRLTAVCRRLEGLYSHPNAFRAAP